VAQFFSSTGGIFAYEENEAKAARDAGVSLSGEYEAAIDIARRISSAMPGGHISVAFTLTASSVNMKDIKLLRLEYGSLVWEYAMGMSVDRQFKWPTPGYDRASLSIVPTNQNLYAQPVKYDGEWALMQLFDAASISGNMVSWEFPTQSGPTLVARLELSGESGGLHPFRSLLEFPLSYVRLPLRDCTSHLLMDWSQNQTKTVGVFGQVAVPP